MVKQKIHKKPRPFYQRAMIVILKLGAIALLSFGIYLLYSLSVFWQLERRSAELPGLHLYPVQESNYTNAFSWYVSYPKIDEPAFDTAAAKIANDAKGAFLARVNFQARTSYPRDDLNVSFEVNSYNDKKLSISVTSRKVLGDVRSDSTTEITYDREKRKIESSQPGKGMMSVKPETTDPGKVPVARRSDADCTKQKCVALTFSDGPSPVTPQILDILKTHHAKATFFETGAQAKLYPDIARRVIKEGHVIGNLGFNHRNLAATSLASATNDINQGEDALEKASGVRPGLARAPYGAITKDLAKKIGMPFVHWNIDTKDDVPRKPDAIYNEVMSKVHPGAVVVSRDTRQATADAYGRVIADLMEKGYTLVTVPQLLSFKGDEQPGIYTN